MFMLNGRSISLDTPFTTPDGTQYPANWLRLASHEERAAIGITEAADPEPYDQRFYWGPNNPKLLNDDQESEPPQRGLKSQWIAQVKDTAGKLLATSDWMVIRKYERNADIPAAVATHRAAIIAECDRLETAIAAAASVTDLESAVTDQNWPRLLEE